MDCDPGHDDAVALMLALSTSRLDLKCVCTTCGNTTGDKTFINARKILTYLGRTDIPVTRGLPGPLTRKVINAPQVHGESGMDGPKFPDVIMEGSKKGSVEMMAELLSQAEDKEYAILVTGPQTNVAAFLSAYPQLRCKIDHISFMGGAIFDANWSAAAEFNILVDPEAARIVMRSGISLNMFGLDVTHKSYTEVSRIEDFRALNTPQGTLVADLLDFFCRWQMHAGMPGMPIHDVNTVLYELYPDLYKMEKLYVDVESHSKYCDGATVADVYHVTGREANCNVAFDIDRERYNQLLLEHFSGRSDL